MIRIEEIQKVCSTCARSKEQYATYFVDALDNLIKEGVLKDNLTDEFIQGLNDEVAMQMNRFALDKEGSNILISCSKDSYEYSIFYDVNKTLIYNIIKLLLILEVEGDYDEEF
ncbi:hypothetical protein [Clostridium perfringens]|uniref:hypothetical protein n=1 Tax=Clostridium perfringens TaxID=1502 RepID=UPI0018E4B035|nr:hypothetical protein [Clostridium perfringens]MBI6052339.1 hypothetical protein [Clostridium perfringens]